MSWGGFGHGQEQPISSDDSLERHMSDPKQAPDFFSMLAKVLLRCWIFGFVLLSIWCGVFFLADDLVHQLHSGVFDLTQHELNVIFYCGMGLFKFLVLVFFFIPWLAITLVLRRQRI